MRFNQGKKKPRIYGAAKRPEWLSSTEYNLGAIDGGATWGQTGTISRLAGQKKKTTKIERITIHPTGQYRLRPGWSGETQAHRPSFWFCVSLRPDTRSPRKKKCGSGQLIASIATDKVLQLTKMRTDVQETLAGKKQKKEKKRLSKTL